MASMCGPVALCLALLCALALASAEDPAAATQPTKSGGIKSVSESSTSVSGDSTKDELPADAQARFLQSYSNSNNDYEMWSTTTAAAADTGEMILSTIISLVFNAIIIAIGFAVAHYFRTGLLDDARAGKPVEPPHQVCRYCCGPFSVYYWEGCSVNVIIALALEFLLGICCYPCCCWTPSPQPLNGGLPVGPAVQSGGYKGGKPIGAQSQK
eukprot:TRINITY_DN43142_c0_g1_i1.p1 TRINITY_DN43142_c0_g1~~TRINITY_DN43142_c0_g1_i1.p1  ORF type:complete len:212 (-),score=36.97 TRINITY_DN43142_c0_g1_i1:248-883(-)